MVNVGGLHSGSRFPSPHIGGFIGPYPTPGGAAPAQRATLVLPKKQAPYRARAQIIRMAGTQAPVPPVSNNFFLHAKQSRYLVRAYIRPWAGPYPAAGGPLSKSKLVRASYARYATRPFYRPWIGPYAPLGSVSENRLHIASQPPYVIYTRRRIPIVGPPAQPPVGKAFNVRAKQPRYVTRLLLRPWIGPYPRLGSVSRSELVRTRYPRYRTVRTYDGRWVYRVPHPIVVVVFRRTLSQEGTRTGTRQDEPWGPNIQHTYAPMAFDSFYLDLSGLS